MRTSSGTVERAYSTSDDGTDSMKSCSQVTRGSEMKQCMVLNGVTSSTSVRKPSKVTAPVMERLTVPAVTVPIATVHGTSGP